MTATMETLESGATLERSSNYGGDRYQYDFGECSICKGFAQVDTRQDASYYGTWANPFTFKIVCYCEGDVTRTICQNEQQFVAEMRRLHKWAVDGGFWKGIDGGFGNDIDDAFNRLGLGDLLHGGS